MLNWIIKKSIILGIIVGLGFDCLAQVKLGSVNFAHHYSPDAEIALEYRLRENGDSLSLFLKLTLHQSKPALNDYIIEFSTGDNYANKLRKLQLSSKDSLYVGSLENHHLLKYNIPASQISRIIVVEVTSKFSGFKYYYDILTTPDPLLLKTSQNQTVLSAWITPGNYHFDSSNSVYGYHYSHIFPPALPPFPVKETLPEKSMSIDTTYILNKGELLFLNDPGLYLFQNDSSSHQGLGLRVENKYFPRLAKLQDLIEPLLYITTKEENQKLEAIKDNKKEFDRFWLDLTKSPERARLIIKNYFDRVEQANEFFTTYKEGWKTDMGMIYIIFGPPDEVNKTLNGETWHFLASTQLPKLSFEFMRTENIFSNSHYVLKREKKFANAWYRAIDLWRKGRF